MDDFNIEEIVSICPGFGRGSVWACEGYSVESVERVLIFVR